jgi:hypothetical protein
MTLVLTRSHPRRKRLRAMGQSLRCQTAVEQPQPERIDNPKPGRIDEPEPGGIETPPPSHVDTPRPDRVVDPAPPEEPARKGADAPANL